MTAADGGHGAVAVGGGASGGGAAQENDTPTGGAGAGRVLLPSGFRHGLPRLRRASYAVVTRSSAEEETREVSREASATVRRIHLRITEQARYDLDGLDDEDMEELARDDGAGEMADVDGEDDADDEDGTGGRATARVAPRAPGDDEDGGAREVQVPTAPRRRAQTQSIKRLSKRELERVRMLYPEAEFADVVRPKTRGDCLSGPNVVRPCAFVGCKYHLAFDVSEETGSIKENFPGVEVWEMPETCALDVADRGGLTLEDVGALMNLTRERIRQIEGRSLARLKWLAELGRKAGMLTAEELETLPFETAIGVRFAGSIDERRTPTHEPAARGLTRLRGIRIHGV
jgi:hypothetical protein